MDLSSLSPKVVSSYACPSCYGKTFEILSSDFFLCVDCKNMMQAPSVGELDKVFGNSRFVCYEKGLANW